MLNISCINFPMQSPCYRYVMVFQYTSLLLHGVSFSHLLVLIFFFLFSLLLLMSPNMGFGGSFVREGELIPILPVHLMWPAASALVFCIDLNLTDGPLGDNICECLVRLCCCWLWRHEDGQEVWRASVVVFGVDVLQKCPRLLVGLGWGQQTLICSALLQETWKHEENWGCGGVLTIHIQSGNPWPWRILRSSWCAKSRTQELLHGFQLTQVLGQAGDLLSNSLGYGKAKRSALIAY